jgi:hypothetical protein
METEKKKDWKHNILLLYHNSHTTQQNYTDTLGEKMVACYYEALYIMTDESAMEYKPDQENENFGIPHVVIRIKSQTNILL